MIDTMNIPGIIYHVYSIYVYYYIIHTCVKYLIDTLIICVIILNNNYKIYIIK